MRKLQKAIYNLRLLHELMPVDTLPTDKARGLLGGDDKFCEPFLHQSPPEPFEQDFCLEVSGQEDEMVCVDYHKSEQTFRIACSAPACRNEVKNERLSRNNH